jgi:hypothetical protein
LVTCLWVFFRSQTIEEAFSMFSFLFHPAGQSALNVEAYVLWCLGGFIVFDSLLYNTRFDAWTASKPVYLRWPIYLTLLFCIIVFSGVENFPFIYFQF